MAIVRCQCKQSLKLPPEQIGRLSACPKCKTPVRIIASAPDGNLKLLARFLIESGPDRIGEQIFFGGAKRLKIGKSQDAHLRLRSSGVSRLHGLLVPSDRGWRIEDQNSTNGLFVNGQRIDDHPLRDGDLLEVGDFGLKYFSGEGNDEFDTTAQPTDAGLGFENDDEGNFTFIDSDHTAQNATNAFASANVTDQPTACPKCSTPLAAGARICVRCGYDLRTGRRVRTVATLQAGESGTGSGIGAYLMDCARSVTFISDSGNLVSFIFVAILAGAAAMLGSLPGSCLFLIARIILNGLLCAFLFNVVLNAANGENDLPDIGFTGDWWDDMITPLLKFFATLFMVFIPTIVYAQTVGPQAWTEFGFKVTLGIGVFFWPISILIMSLGGIGCFLRPDQILLTVARTYLPYLVTCAVTGLAFAATWMLHFSLSSVTASLGGNEWAIATVLWLANVYFLIVAMQCIGLYYHHFKGRFAWSWG